MRNFCIGLGLLCIVLPLIAPDFVLETVSYMAFRHTNLPEPVAAAWQHLTVVTGWTQNLGLGLMLLGMSMKRKD